MNVCVRYFTPFTLPLTVDGKDKACLCMKKQLCLRLCRVVQYTLSPPPRRNDIKYVNKVVMAATNLGSDDSSEAKALLTLSEMGYAYWRKVYELAKWYSHMILQDGSHCLHRKGTPKSSARIIAEGERCDCNRRIAFESMYEHECAMNGGIFVISLFAERMFQPRHMKAIDSIDQISEEARETTCATVNDGFGIQLNNNTGQEEEEKDYGPLSQFHDDDIPFSQLQQHQSRDSHSQQAIGTAKRKSTDINGDENQQKRPAKVPRTRVVEACQMLADLIANASVKVNNDIFASVVQLQDVARGKLDVRAAQRIVESAVLTRRSSAPKPPPKSYALAMPLSGPEGNKVGAPRTTRLPSAAMARNGGTQ